MQFVDVMKIAFVACFLAGSPVAADESNERNALMSEAAKLYKDRDFEALEAMTTRFRSGRERTGSGTFKLSFVYDAIEGQLNDDKSTPADQVLRENQKTVDGWLKKYPSSLAARIMNAKIMLKWGWLARGNGWASSVTPQGWKTFRQRGQQAQSYLTRKGAAGVKDAEWFVVMLDAAIAQGASREALLAIFDLSLKFDPEDLGPIKNMVRYSTNRWGGSRADIDDIVSRVVAANLPENQAEAYARAYWVVEGTRDDQENWLAAAYNLNWPKMRDGFDVIIKKYPTSWNLNNFAWFACSVRDYETAQRLVPIIGDNIEVKVWEKNMFPCVINYHGKVMAAKRAEAEDARVKAAEARKAEEALKAAEEAKGKPAKRR